MQVSIKSDIRAVMREFRDVKEKSIPYALAGAINDTLFDLRKIYPQEMKGVFDKPVPFTTMPSAWQIHKASRSMRTGTIRLKDVQASYLKWQVYGGLRTPRKRAIPIPQAGGSAIAAHGGLKRNWKRLLDDPRYFSGTPKGGGRPGIYKRLGTSKKNAGGKRIRLELAWEDNAMYGKMWRFEESTQFRVHRLFSDNLKKRMMASRIYQQTH